MFLVIWKVLEPDAPATGTARTQPAPAGTDSNFRVTLLPLVFTAVIALIVVRWARGFNRLNAVGMKALHEGDYSEAGKSFERAVARYRWPPASAASRASTWASSASTRAVSPRPSITSRPGIASPESPPY
jgi:hypothetical protein